MVYSRTPRSKRVTRAARPKPSSKPKPKMKGIKSVKKPGGGYGPKLKTR